MGPFDVVVEKDLPHRPVRLADPFVAVQPRLVKVGKAIPFRGLW